MKQKLIIVSGLFLLLILILIMSYDLFLKKNSTDQNFYEYNLDKFRKTDTTFVNYAETRQFEFENDVLCGIKIDNSNNIFFFS